MYISHKFRQLAIFKLTTALSALGDLVGSSPTSVSYALVQGGPVGHYTGQSYQTVRGHSVHLH